MIHLKLFENFKPIISYDFDGVLHVSVIGVHPIDFVHPDRWVPFTEMHEQLREDAKDHKIIVVTARPEDTNEFLWEFIKMHDLPVEEIYAVNNGPKTPILISTGAIRHYDDNEGMRNALKPTGIEFVLVNPFKRTMELTESLNEDTLKSYTITFTNPKFYIADNTLQAFLNRLKKLDPELKHDPKLNGKGKDHRLMYIKSSVITHEQIRNLILQFTQNYDYLSMNVVGMKSF